MRDAMMTTPLSARLKPGITAFDKKAAKVGLDRLHSRIDDDDRPALAALMADATVAGVLEGVFGTSPYLTTLAVQDAGRLIRVLTTPPEATLDRLVSACAADPADEAGLMRQLRLVKQEAALTLGLADLGLAYGVPDVTAGLTRIADAATSAAIRYALRESAERGRMTLAHADDPERDSGLIVLAMGKHGAFELNYSSDIDLIVFFDATRAHLADPDEATETFVRITKRFVRILQERTPDGYVFRVDLRLRPDPGATPMAMSLDGAFQYYESMGQNWERAALIKARPCAGDIAAGDYFLKEIQPFIWRRSFDFAAIADVHSIKRQIHAHKGHDEIAIAGHNVKLGRGGIREIEFFVQTQQLIAGGRDPTLRGRATLAMLDRLTERNWITPDVRDALTAAYLMLRAVEHRIQMVADEQTHEMPRDDKGCERIARMMGQARLAPFAKALTATLVTVQSHYARLFESAPQLSSGSGNLVFTGGDDDPGTIATLKQLGFRKPGDVTAAIRAWHFGRYPAVRSSVARERLTEITPALLEAIAATKNADAAFLAFDRLVSRLPVGVQLFSLLASKPGLLALIVEIVGAAPKLADLLTRRPRVIDALTDPAFFARLPDADELRQRLATFMDEAALHEEKLDRARIFAQEQQFLVGARIMAGTLSPTLAGEAYARLAGVVLDLLFQTVMAEFARAHGRIAAAECVIVAMGKLGGREMTAASDLDLMLLYRLNGEDTSDGDRPLAATQYFARLTQRLIAALSAPTAEGIAYEVDFRLRPSGNKGPLATELSGFIAYQSKDAWTWEHMALTRARVVAGDAALAADAQAAIRAVLTAPRDAARTRADILDMRRTITEAKGTKDHWNIKQVPGGLVDLEFIAQGLALLHGGAHPDMLATATADLLRGARDCGVLAPEDADALLPALDLQNGLTQVLRVALEGDFKASDAPPGLIDRLKAVGNAPDLKRLEGELSERQQAVRVAYGRVLGG